MNNVDPVILKQLKENSSWFLALGISLVVIGTLAIAFSFYSTLFSVVYLGLLLIALGLFEGIKAFKMRPLTRCFLHVLLSMLYIFSGVYIVAYPMSNAITLTLLLAFLFMVSGALRIVFSFVATTPHRGWLLVNGLLTLLLGILIYHQWPESGLWVIGMFLGIDAIFTGWSWIVLALAAKDSKLNAH